MIQYLRALQHWNSCFKGKDLHLKEAKGHRLCWSEAQAGLSVETDMAIKFIKAWMVTKDADCQWDYPGKSFVSFMPEIDTSSSDKLYLICPDICPSEARYHHLRLIITFDQPLWWKTHDLTVTFTWINKYFSKGFTNHWIYSAWRTGRWWFARNLDWRHWKEYKSWIYVGEHEQLCD